MSTARISLPTLSRPGMGTIRRRVCASLALAVSLAATPAASADGSTSRAATLSRLELDGSRITVSAHCNAPTKVQLQAGRRQLGKALAECRAGTARSRFALAPATLKQLTGPHAPQVHVRVGSERTTVSFARPGTSAGVKAHASSGGYWSRPRASCTQMSYGYPPYSLFVSRLVEINLGGELFGYRVSTLLRARGLYWVYESASRQYWVTTAWYDTFAGMTGRHSGFNLPLQATASVMPAVQLYNGEWNWVSVGWATGATAHAPNWCYFPPAS